MNKIGIVIFTVIEVVGLAVWLALADRGMFVLAPVVLAAFLIVEHTITYNVVRGFKLSNLDGPGREIILFSVIEGLIWVVWLLLANGAGVGWAVPFLFGALVIEHTISDNVFRHEGFLNAIAKPQVIGFSAVEVVAATGWLFLVREGDLVFGIGVLLVGSLIEHVMAVKVSQRRETA